MCKMFCFYSFCLLISILVWILPEEDHETKIQVKIVYLGSTVTLVEKWKGIQGRKGSQEISYHSKPQKLNPEGKL